MPKTELKEFNVTEVPLSGSNLIEASAGTGKTYSIAILVLRLIAEKNIDLREILMVTFTKAAVAELESRIRKFVRQAYKYISEERSCDTMICNIVNSAIEQSDRHEVARRLKNATLYLDETSIFTIHSFCQKTLTQFAFETGQLFGCVVTDDNAEITARAVNEYWRRNITTLEAQKLKVLTKYGFSKSDIEEVVTKDLSDKHFVYSQELDLDKIFTSVSTHHQRAQMALDDFMANFESSPERDPGNINSNRYAKNAFSGVLDNAREFWAVLQEKKNTVYVKKIMPQLLEYAISYDQEETAARESSQEIIYHLYGEAIADTRDYIECTKQRLSLFTYDDLIHHLHRAVSHPEAGALCGELQKKYRAVFIDEFQDTDKFQYEIFNNLFGKGTILFYIGDPKQAIYSFRGADIDTYKLASQGVDKAYTMRSNYRSTPNLIAALNGFFPSVENPFCDDQIGYERVSPGIDPGELQCKGNDVAPMTLISLKNKKDIYGAVASEILELLTGSYKIGNRAVVPSDIAVLVRGKMEGEDVKAALTHVNIPSVTIDQAKVLESEEAKNVFYVMQAALEPNKSNINRALLTKFTHTSQEDLLVLDVEQELSNFRDIREVWLRNGVYGALWLFMRLYRVRTCLLDGHLEDGERSITNLLQIIELLHKSELEHRFSPDELISWLQRVFDGAEASGDEFVQRMESDDDAVKIATIHKSKGLSYNIVLAPFLDLSSAPRNNSTFIDYKHPESGQYRFSPIKSEEEKQWYQTQTEQENRRLIYVALTRAVYKCYIFTTHKGCVGQFVDGVLSGTQKTRDISVGDVRERVDSSDVARTLFESKDPQFVDGVKYHPVREEIMRKGLLFSGSVTSGWRMISFSALNKHHVTYIPDKSSVQQEYDNFVFSQMPRGSMAGNFLHEIFEQVDFAVEDFSDVIATTGKRYPSVYQEELLEEYNNLVLSVLQSSCQSNEAFQLKDIPNHKKLPEMEFCFDVGKCSTVRLQEMARMVKIDDYRTLEGAMVGFIDLFFEHKGKYYLLDWKSNFLGSSLDDYTPDKLEVAMTANNYHLQYLIYTIAAKRFLESRLPDFDYERDFGGVFYLFLRGCRQNQTLGVFFTKPEMTMVEQMDLLMKGALL